ncbi:MAG: hypothetical protein ACRDRT_14735, partial [Pseudonocardiaceae bacterium]
LKTTTSPGNLGIGYAEAYVTPGNAIWCVWSDMAQDGVIWFAPAAETPADIRAKTPLCRPPQPGHPRPVPVLDRLRVKADALNDMLPQWVIDALQVRAPVIAEEAQSTQYQGAVTHAVFPISVPRHATATRTVRVTYPWDGSQDTFTVAAGVGYADVYAEVDIWPSYGEHMGETMYSVSAVYETTGFAGYAESRPVSVGVKGENC